MKILSLQELKQADIELLNNAGSVEYTYLPAKNVTQADLDDVNVILGYDDKLTPLLQKNNSVKWIQAWSAGVDQLPQNVFKEKGIQLTNASGAMVPGLAEQIIGQMISWDRNLGYSFAVKQKHKWDELAAASYQELAGKKLLLLGVGHIGQQVAKIATVFGMHVIGVRHSDKPANNVEEIYTFEQIFQVAGKADFVLNTLPVTAQTEDVIDQKFFLQMKKSAVYINYGRGKTNNESDLIQALQTEQIAGAIMDVFKEEPLPKDSAFWKLLNVLITPHTGGDTALYDRRVVKIAADNISMMNDDSIKPQKNVVDLRQGY